MAIPPLWSAPGPRRDLANLRKFGVQPDRRNLLLPDVQQWQAQVQIGVEPAACKLTYQ